jgi:glycosyltransferase involved in cell wall biosynthesis
MPDRAGVLYLAPSGDLRGGAQIQYKYLIDGLSGSRYEPIVLAPMAGDFNEALACTGVQTDVSPYPTWNRGEVLHWGHRLWLERRRARRRLIAFARARAPRIVHGDFAVAPYLTAISDALDIPSVVHMRGPLQRRRVHRLGLTRATRLIAIGHGYRDELIDAGLPAERITIVHDATDLSRFHPRHGAILRTEDPSIAADEIIVGIVGRIEPFKRQLEFLHAAERVLATGRRARFFVVGGSNPNRPFYYRRTRAFPAARGIERSVTFTGLRDDIEHVIASLDVLVTLSGGSVMLEAMACGVPVVTASARDADSLHIVRDGESGRVVPADDPGALVRAIEELCDDPGERRRLGANGRRRAEALFGRNRLVEETIRVYDALLGAATAHSARRVARLEPAAVSYRAGRSASS